MAQFFFPPSRVLTIAGIIAPGAKAKFYLSGTLTPATVYADSDMLTPLGPVVTADAYGKFPAIYYDDESLIRVIVETATGIEIDDIDPYNPDTLRDDLRAGTGAALIGNAGGGTVQDAIFRRGNQTTADKMVVDWQFGQSSYLPENIGGAWEAQTYSHLLIYKEIDTDTVVGDANPTIGGGPVANFTTLTDNMGAEGDVVGNLNVVVARANGSYTSFCRNDVLMGDTGVNQKVVLHEWDLQLASGNVGGAGSAGLIINAFNNAYNAPVFLIGGYNGGTWQDGLVFSNIRGAMLSVNSSDATTATSFIDTQNGEFSAAAIKLGKGASQGIAFGAGAFGTSPYLYCATGSNDLFMTLGASGVLKINASDGSESFWVNANNPMWRIKPLLFSQLPTAGTIGRRAYVTDSSTATYGATVTGGGANKVPVHDNGTNWVVG